MNAFVKMASIIALTMTFYANAANFDHTHKKWAQVLDTYRVEDGRVRYEKLKTEDAQNRVHPFGLYLKDLAAVKKAEFSGWTRAQQMAFLINAYNALTAKLIVDHYPVKGIRKIGSVFTSPWKIKFFSLLEGDIRTLDQIEHEYLRGKYQEPLIHAAVNCASFSCPPLWKEPFVAERLTEQLETVFRAFLADEARNRFEPKAGVLRLSEIFKWFGDDFKSAYGDYLNAIQRFGPESAREAIKHGKKVEWISYDWSLNDTAANVSTAK